MMQRILHRKFSTFKQIEQKWQKQWQTKPLRQGNQGKKYILGQFPYPSGALHMGHVRVYTICDALSRYYSMRDFDVMCPMGWDSFGLPAENAALKQNVNPEDWTNQNIKQMKNQLDNMGFLFDWDREISTCQPQYYKHTQQIFLEMFNKGLAYKKDCHVNWDPVDQTVLANEQIDSQGRSWRSGALVQRKQLSQWNLNIRKYADEMLESLDYLDQWPESVKEAQRGWIGKSCGSKIKFDTQFGSVDVFTTSPQTIFGVTFIAVSFENIQLVNELKQQNSAANFVIGAYTDKMNNLKVSGVNVNEVDVQNIDQGVKVPGVTATHPITGQQLPIYVTSYVHADYGTGVVMGVPYHDERDLAFALANQLDIVQVITQDNKSLCNSGEFSGLDLDQAKQEIVKRLACRHEHHTQYRLRDWLISRQRYWGVPIPIMFDNQGQPKVVSQLPVVLPKITDATLLKQFSPLSKIPDFCQVIEDGKQYTLEVDTMDTFMDSSWYFLRFLDPHNQNDLCSTEILKNWMPVDIYVGGMEHAIMHLLYARFVHKFICDIRDISDKKLREPFKELIVQGLVKGQTYKDAAGQYLSKHEPGCTVTFEKMSKSKGNGVVPESMASIYGVDVLRTALMFGAPPESDLMFDESMLQSMQSYLQRVIKLKPTKLQTDQRNDQLMQQALTLLVDYETKMQQRLFHVAVARLMELTNAIQKSQNNHQAYIYLLQALYPFAPHTCCELYFELTNEDIRQSCIPNYSELLKNYTTKVQLRIQINGKFITILEIDQDIVGNLPKILEKIKDCGHPKLRQLQSYKQCVEIPGKPVVNFII